MSSASLTLRELGKSFNRRPILSSISDVLRSPGSLAITGRNGSGKSTLVRIIAGVMAPSRGNVDLEVNGRIVPVEERYRYVGFVAPYLSLYDEFSARENIELLEAMRSGRKADGKRIEELFERVGLLDRQHDRLGTYSSGMKQRVKYIFAMIHRPELLILDEPTSNLDSDGTALVETIVKEQQRSGMVVVATNETEEAAWCEQRIELTVRR